MLIILIIIIIIPGQFIKHRKWWFGSPHQGRFDIFNDDGRECSWLNPTYQRHITLAAVQQVQAATNSTATATNSTASTGCYLYRLLPTTPPSPSRHYYPRLIAGTNLPTPKGWIAWLAKANCSHITFAQGYYTIESKGTGRK